MFESTDLFVRGVGETTDIVEKEMYTFPDKSERSMTLRPEWTAPVVRAALEHNLFAQGPLRVYYVGPIFRYERPQKRPLSPSRTSSASSASVTPAPKRTSKSSRWRGNSFAATGSTTRS